jgi:hypothetical protein
VFTTSPNHLRRAETRTPTFYTWLRSLTFTTNRARQIIMVEQVRAEITNDPVRCHRRSS